MAKTTSVPKETTFKSNDDDREPNSNNQDDDYNNQIKDLDNVGDDDSHQPLVARTPPDSENMKSVMKSMIQNGSITISPHSTRNSINNRDSNQRDVKAIDINGGGGGDGSNGGLDNLTSSEEIIDRYNIVYITMIVHGIGILMPWNMFINAKEYFTEYKLTTKLENGTLVDSPYKDYFLSYIGAAAQVPNVLFNLLNIFFHFGGENFTFRIILSIIIEVFIIIATIVLAVLDTQQWTSTFFFLTMVSVVLLNIVNGIYQNSLYGLASKLPMSYSNAVVLGSNISGTFTSVVNIISIGLSPNYRIAAIYYFVSALAVLFFCFDTFLMLPINKFFRFYIQNNGKVNIETPMTVIKNDAVDHEKIENQNLISDKSSMVKTANDSTVATKSKDRNEIKNTRPPYLFVFRYVWKQCLNVFMVFFVTLSIFPVIHSGIKPIDPNYFQTEKITKDYFTAVCCFLVFNSCAMFGNIIPSFVVFPGPDRLWIPIFSRLLFIPFFLFCNYEPVQRTWPIWIQSDTLFILGGILMGLSSGYYSSLCMMYAPKSVPHPEHAGTAGMMAAASLVLGIFFGINFSSLLAWLVR